MCELNNTNPRLRRCRGFTLIELLVVIAVIATMLALLLPAVQQAREAARRTSCKNKLKQLALAIHLYHDVKQVIPHYGYHNWNRSDCWTWGSMILPFIEQGNLENHLDLDGFPMDPQNVELLRTPLSVFRCPSEIGPESATITELGSLEPATVALGNYGLNWELFSYDEEFRHVKFNDVTDGLTNTILLGETIISALEVRGFGSFITGANWCCGMLGLEGFQDLYSLHGYVDTSWGNHGYVDTYWRNEPVLGLFHAPASYHPGGTHFALCDGSVRFIPRTIDEHTWEGLIQGNDGIVVGQF